MDERPRRFARWIQRDDAPKELYLAEIGGSWDDDDVALARVNANYGQPRPTPDGLAIRGEFTAATVRLWVKDDPEFALALKAAKQAREEARRLGLDKQPEMVPPDRWPASGRLDQRPDPFRTPAMFGGANGTR